MLTDCYSLILTDSHWKVSLRSKHHPEWRLPNVWDFEQKKVQKRCFLGPKRKTWVLTSRPMILQPTWLWLTPELKLSHYENMAEQNAAKNARVDSVFGYVCMYHCVNIYVYIYMNIYIYI